MIKQTILLVLRIILGCILIVLGIAGLILPIMPGWIFLIPGLVLVLQPLVSVCRESKIPIIRETACRLSDKINKSRIKQYLESRKNKSKREAGGGE
ncbi:MAG: hypothetical protein PHE84_09335 [bacterium]|nr:hypothetical protein [bacterium]